ncbi:YhgE/Pip domain-containing protein [Nocardioides pantholopis]|uniref:YhgE/Pip domain-containing protein n=1 Tax=Nocardioides pantholopis TaxID=2483798 RepID=UPI000FDB8E3E|nr:YhgE/Pip domain-containing protein [Nocardioides pantholopis]
MIAIRLASTELRRLSAGKLPKLAILALILIPSLYSGLYLFANEDPYGRLGEVPAALVVQDRGATLTDAVNGGTREEDYGEQVAQRLVDGDGGFDWVRTTQSDAEAGVRSGRFDSALLIGPAFSEDLVSSADFRPRQASLTLVTNDANSYLSATIADTIVGEVRDAIATQVGTQAADTFLKGFASIHTNLASGVQGAERLVTGTARLSRGAGELVGGTARLASGADQVASGASRLSAGTGELTSGVDRLASGAATLSSGLGTLRSRTAALPAQTRKLASGAQRVARGNAQVSAVGRDAAAAVRLIDRRLDAANRALDRRVAALVRQGRLTRAQAAAIRTVLDDARAPVDAVAARVQRASRQLDRLGSGSAELANGAQRLASATPELTSGIARAASGGTELASGTARLQSGAGTFASDTARLASGAAEVSSGADRLARSTPTLRRGTERLESGVAKLRNGLRQGLGKIPDLDESTEEETARTIGDPVKVVDDTIARAGSYGAGLAPFFMSLATWIGAYVLFLLVRPLSSRSLASDAPAWQTALGGWIPGAVLGVGQVAVMFAVVKFALDIDVVHAVATAVLLLLASAAFVAILQALNVWLGATGQFLGLVLMLVQLVTAGGTFPWQTIPEPLRSLHRVLPMSYVVDGLRQTLYGGDLGLVALDIGLLAAVFVVALLATTYAARRQRVWSPQRLEPELVL